ncbi:MAG: hypothetical protein K8S20_15540 [Chloroflexi bacterium]|nr:hypothetical protein [Chloroflexota bacterium]
MLNDGQHTYIYDSANRLTSVDGASSYSYNGLGDRLAQDGTQYTLDLNSDLTQVLDDGTNSYTYGLGRISQKQGAASEYFLGDALGSVRQLTNNAGEITYAKSYDPYGMVTQTSGAGKSAYGYTGEQQDPSGMTYLRARYYNPNYGSFLSRDTWGGDVQAPLSLNSWIYTYSDPINYADPSGHCAGFKGLNVPIKSVMLLAAPNILKGSEWKATGNAWKDAWTTCKDSFQKAGAAWSRGDYGRAFTYASGTTAAFLQASDRLAKLNHETDVIFCKDASLGDRVLAALDWASVGMSVSMLVTPVIMGALNAASIGEIGYYDEMLSPTMGHGGYYSEYRPISVNVNRTSTNLALYDPEFASLQVKSEAAYYVRPNGDVIPATGYRYISNKASYLEELTNTKLIPTNSDPLGTYISFNKFETPAAGSLQTPFGNNSSIRMSFDTLQIIDDVRIPYGNNGGAPWLEPLTVDYPEFGPGGATQAITNRQILINQVISLLIK